MDAAGDIFIADHGNNAVKEILPDGTINTIGSGFCYPKAWRWTRRATSSSPTPATTPSRRSCPTAPSSPSARGSTIPTGVAVDAAGDVFVADYGHSAVKEVLPDGTINTIGSGFSHPEGVAVDATGDVFVADTATTPSRRFCPTAPSSPSARGSPTRAAWRWTRPATSSSPTPATTPSKEVLPGGTIITIGSGFSDPVGVAVDAAGDVFVADTEQQPSRRAVAPRRSPPRPSPLTGSTATSISGHADRPDARHRPTTTARSPRDRTARSPDRPTRSPR